MGVVDATNNTNTTDNREYTSRRGYTNRREREYTNSRGYTSGRDYAHRTDDDMDDDDFMNSENATNNDAFKWFSDFDNVRSVFSRAESHLSQLTNYISGVKNSFFRIENAEEIRVEINEQAPKAKKSDSLENRIASIHKAFKYLSKNKSKWQKGLGIKSSAATDRRIDRINKNIISKDEEQRKLAVEEGEAMMKILRTHMNTVVAMNSISTVLKTVKVILAGALFFAMATAAAPYVAISVTIVYIAFEAFESVMVNDDPFNAPKTWSKKIAHQIREGILCPVRYVYKACKAAYRAIENVVQNLTNTKPVEPEVEKVKTNIPTRISEESEAESSDIEFSETEFSEAEFSEIETSETEFFQGESSEIEASEVESEESRQKERRHSARFIKSDFPRKEYKFKFRGVITLTS